MVIGKLIKVSDIYPRSIVFQMWRNYMSWGLLYFGTQLRPCGNDSPGYVNSIRGHGGSKLIQPKKCNMCRNISAHSQSLTQQNCATLGEIKFPYDWETLISTVWSYLCLKPSHSVLFHYEERNNQKKCWSSIDLCYITELYLNHLHPLVLCP